MRWEIDIYECAYPDPRFDITSLVLTQLKEGFHPAFWRDSAAEECPVCL